MLYELISYLHIYETHMSLALNESSAVWRFEHIDTIKICGGIIFLLRTAWVRGYLAEFNIHIKQHYMQSLGYSLCAHRHALLDILTLFSLSS